jgi:hypothetical protein
MIDPIHVKCSRDKGQYRVMRLKVAGFLAGEQPICRISDLEAQQISTAAWKV